MAKLLYKLAILPLQEVQENALCTVSKLMVEAPVLAYPKSLNVYMLDTDASAHGSGAAPLRCLKEQSRVLVFMVKRLVCANATIV